MPRPIAIIITCALVAVGVLGANHAASGATPNGSGAATEIAAAINAERFGEDLTLLGIDPTLTAFAQEWADHLAAQEGLAHRDELGKAAWAAGVRFTNVGENVGEGDSVAELHAAFMASSAHRENVMAPEWTRVGVGVAVDDDGRLWVAVNFADSAT